MKIFHKPIFILIRRRFTAAETHNTEHLAAEYVAQSMSGPCKHGSVAGRAVVCGKGGHMAWWSIISSIALKLPYYSLTSWGDRLKWGKIHGHAFTQVMGLASFY